MAKQVKLSDIAERVGVSSVTVSKALAGKSGVSESKRRLIKEVANELGYKPVSAKKTKKQTGNIGVLIPTGFLEQGTSFYWVMYQKVVTQLTKRGYYGILEILQHPSEVSLEIPKIIADNKVDGLIVIGQISEEYAEYLWTKEEIPMVFLDFYDSHQKYDAVISDGFYGMYVMTNYLLGMGHREIAFVGSPFTTTSITDRYFGYMKAMMEKGIEVPKEWIIPDRDPLEGQMIEIELPKKMPTAFACNCDAAAAGLIKQLNQADIKVPKDVSVVGFDNYLYPNLDQKLITTYEVRMEQMAKSCSDTLVRKITGKDYVKGLQIVTGELVPKKTVRRV